MDDIQLTIIVSAVLGVAVEEFKDCSRRIANKKNWHQTTIWEFLREFDAYLKPKSVEERVTVDEVHTTPLNYSPNCAFTCHIDGKPAGPLHSKRDYAEVYRLGLIQQLKEQSQ